jgi:AcrR family transcriptional regulator
MSPYPAQTDRDSIIDIVCIILENDGVNNLSLNRVASEIGIKAPSLYRHVAHKTDLLKTVIERTFTKLFEAYETALENTSTDPEEQLLALFHAHREFAHANPNAYTLAYTTTIPELHSDPAELERQAIIMQEILANITGQEQSFPALRGALALVRGFVMLELKDQLQRDGDLTIAFDTSVNAYLRGLKSISTTP